MVSWPSRLIAKANPSALDNQQWYRFAKSKVFFNRIALFIITIFLPTLAPLPISGTFCQAAFWASCILALSLASGRAKHKHW
ncbi:hypothetical protein K450DRAFT_231466 [Umbelopsis ramanniana AG]|uniref:Uncharacterized protein n=1 Tax=Umbelopsis ramanniana AG TaxID=1314678 RepID=A0AAD5EDT0_UMBRA|nr:uncharacterized protein K450DRAFT_231466 [Umbelopsis ramanniana AG]KAI8581472.1 hypothetical protein K450DRAFT_231466 [Umbelopsis ramanniana AG]